MAAIVDRTLSRFGDRDKVRTVIAGIFIFALIAACAISARVYSSGMPAHAERDTINITETEYEQALAKWEAQGVGEYTATVRKGRDQLTIRVVPAKAEIYLLEWLRDGETYVGASPDPNNPVMPGLYQNYTVPSLFETARGWLDLMEAGAPLGKPIEETDYFHDFIVRFDPELGYPTQLSHHTRAVHRSREVVWREEAEPIIEVKNLAVNRSE